ncbi:hypothetical protein [Lentzea sp. NPDC059081]|uniref:hypothetical protein n=1 Tax=Lentzea sp. NPDC059081 TaxID=3346719 RepID=UPI0036BC1CAF
MRVVASFHGERSTRSVSAVRSSFGGARSPFAGNDRPGAGSTEVRLRPPNQRL